MTEDHRVDLRYFPHFQNVEFYIYSDGLRKALSSVEAIPVDDLYDTPADADGIHKHDMYLSFIKEARVLYKNEIVKILPNVLKKYPKLGIKPFTEIYKSATTEKDLPEDTPGRIVKGLKYRSHVPKTAVRIEKDLVVVTDERPLEYLDMSEQKRTYYDGRRAYYFKKNIVTGKWENQI